MVIKEIRKKVTEQLGPEVIMIFAPIAADAMNVEGNTIQSVFKMSKCFKSFADLKREAARYLQISMDSV